MAPLGTLARSPYNTLLKTIGTVYFDLALYPPVKTNLFNVGTVYSYAANDEIQTIDNLPRMVPSVSSYS
jgi:hypothetical protein